MIFHLAMIITAILLMYHRTFKYGYIIDDIEVVQPKEKETKNKYKRAFEHLMGWKYTDSKLAHVSATLLHLTNCILIYFVFGHNNISFITALFFGLNPVTNASAIWLSGKPYAYSAVLLLIGLLALPLLPFIYGFCIYFAPNAIFFPLLFTMKNPHNYLFILPIIGFLFSKKFRTAYKTRVKGGSDDMVKPKMEKIIIVVKTLGYYFTLCLFPFHLGMCHTYLHTFGMTPEESKKWYGLDRYFCIGIALIIASGFAFFYRSNPVAYGFLWFIFLTIQWCNFIMVNHPITERYIYLSTMGLMYMLANLTIGTPFLWIFLTLYAVRLFYFMPAYVDLKSFWKSNTENFPDVAMGYNQYGLGLVQFGNTGSAIDVLIQGVQKRPNDFRVNYNLANIMLATGNTQQSIVFLKTAEANLEKKNNYEFWSKQINNMKNEIRKRGFEYVDTLCGTPIGSQA